MGSCAGSLVPAPGEAVGGGGEAADVQAVLGGEDQPQDEGPLQEDEGDDAAIEAGDAHGRDPRGGRRRTWPTAQRRGRAGLLLEKAGARLLAVEPREGKEKW